MESATETYFSRGAMVMTEIVHRRPRRRFSVKFSWRRNRTEVACHCDEQLVHRRQFAVAARSTFAAAGVKPEGDVKGANESDKDDVGMSDADVEDSLNNDLQTKKIVDQTKAVRKIHAFFTCRRM
ncbi:conserved hypothetical protein [Culex quinquefasciatus]|uniref:Uncharacterized protein n=1 Tax=Culex quinquefasciatus TaxID=7176 RepID=B0X6L7_CULQU|nr:conserved hypothetical protein [Culex quinquefasciatus]|eukprot:XP_001865289.1 conserved hypothetical protein [Culex quinquefasciatus]